MRFLLTVLILFFTLTTNGQSAFVGVQKDTVTLTVRKFDKIHIEDYKSNSKFDYSNQLIPPKESYFEKILNWFGRIFKKFLEMVVGTKNLDKVFIIIIRILPYAIGLLFLYLLLKFFMNRNLIDFISTAKNRKINPQTEEEELIRNTDLSSLLEQAIADKNYRVAIRYNYLLVLKKLDEANIIFWEQQKTNEDFINEISLAQLKEVFSEITRLYDFVWYGEFGLTHEEFLQASSDFEVTYNLIKKNKR